MCVCFATFQNFAVAAVVEAVLQQQRKFMISQQEILPQTAIDRHKSIRKIILGQHMQGP
jgi:hypothetical protein